MSNMANQPPPNPTVPPAPKRRKLGFIPPGTYRRNCGSNASFVPMSAEPAPRPLSLHQASSTTTTTKTTTSSGEIELGTDTAAGEYDGGGDGDNGGSDTESEDNNALEQFFLDKMTDDTDTKVQTVFGDGVVVWRSHGGTVYTDLSDKEKKRRRAEEIWGVKRKREDEVDDNPMDKKKGDGDDKEVVKNDHGKPIPLPPDPPGVLPARGGAVPYPPRTPNDTRFNRGSAGIDPLGAYNRPIKPLPSRSRQERYHLNPYHNLNHMQNLNLNQNQNQHETPQYDNHQRGAVVLNPTAAPQAAHRIVSGSFGSFEVRQPSRFDERAYRLLPGQGKTGGEKKGDGGVGDGKVGREEMGTRLDPFKGKPWLRGCDWVGLGCWGGGWYDVGVFEAILSKARRMDKELGGMKMRRDGAGAGASSQSYDQQYLERDESNTAMRILAAINQGTVILVCNTQLRRQDLWSSLA
ncbi:hypothetical protein N0V83_010631 [Neocucurbitaria cava]|uniref:Uncharacterized protein n=1 Tax=Neocucurbitaria cava TaxID=798079 RepID=A0A9W8XXW8_9PLEO|nr:hypothetical protein N0V83_010631 [Neocucurbitaria cava]